MSEHTGLWGVIPAAGSGERMQSHLPKQFLPLREKPVLQRAIDTLLAVNGMQGVYVAVQAADRALFDRLAASADARVHLVTGADHRAGSVAAAVQAVRELAGDEVWVLVHDAARPLVSLDDIHRLVERVVASSAIGGLLATPVQDTLKQASEQVVGPSADGTQATSAGTVSRDRLWQAQTPQMFRAGELGRALVEGMAAMAADSRVAITDEASVFERLGERPLLVESQHPNMKITRPSDLALAEALLAMSDAQATTC